MSDNRCVCCNEIIAVGTQVCISCVKRDTISTDDEEQFEWCRQWSIKHRRLKEYRKFQFREFRLHFRLAIKSLLNAMFGKCDVTTS